MMKKMTEMMNLHDFFCLYVCNKFNDTVYKYGKK
jgi:hypothetical protein